MSNLQNRLLFRKPATINSSTHITSSRWNEFGSFYSSVSSLQSFRQALHSFLSQNININNQTIQDNNNNNNRSAVFLLATATAPNSTGVRNSDDGAAEQLLKTSFVPEVECGIGTAAPDGVSFRPIVVNAEKRQQIVDRLRAKKIVRPHAYWDVATVRTTHADYVVCEYDPIPCPSSFSKIMAKSRSVTSNSFRLSKIFFKHDMPALGSNASNFGPANTTVSPLISANYIWFGEFRRSELLFGGYLKEFFSLNNNNNKSSPYSKFMTRSQMRNFLKRKKHHEEALVRSGGNLGKVARTIKEDILRNFRISHQQQQKHHDSSTPSSSRSGGTVFSRTFQIMKQRDDLRDELQRAGIGNVLRAASAAATAVHDENVSDNNNNNNNNNNISRMTIERGAQSYHFDPTATSSLSFGSTDDYSSLPFDANRIQLKKERDAADKAGSRSYLEYSSSSSSPTSNNINNNQHQQQQQEQMAVVSTRRTLGFKCRFRNEVSLIPPTSSTASFTSTPPAVLASLPYNEIVYRNRRVFRSEKYGVEIHITSARRMKDDISQWFHGRSSSSNERGNNNNNNNRTLGHLGDGRIILAKVPFCGSGEKKRQQQQQLRSNLDIQHSRGKNVPSNTHNHNNDDEENFDSSLSSMIPDGLEDDGNDAEEKRPSATVKKDEYRSIFGDDKSDKQEEKSQNNNNNNNKTCGFGDDNNDDGIYWAGHSSKSTIEVEMINPLEGDPEERMEKMLTVVNEIIEAGWPTRF